jgi:hypothetical protein
MPDCGGRYLAACAMLGGTDSKARQWVCRQACLTGVPDRIQGALETDCVCKACKLGASRSSGPGRFTCHMARLLSVEDGGHGLHPRVGRSRGSDRLEKCGKSPATAAPLKTRTCIIVIFDSCRRKANDADRLAMTTAISAPHTVFFRAQHASGTLQAGLAQRWIRSKLLRREHREPCDVPRAASNQCIS